LLLPSSLTILLPVSLLLPSSLASEPFPVLTTPTWTLTNGHASGISFNNTWEGGLDVFTSIEGIFDEEGITLRYNVKDDPVQQNAYDVCNEDVFNQEVVEVFITPDTDQKVIDKYYEVELTPKGTGWIGYDNNPGGKRTNLTHVLQDCASVSTAITKRKKDGWSGEIRLPFDLIGKAKKYRANFFRVQMNPSAWEGVTATTDIPCDPSNCTYSCWNCPTTPQPDFHQSAFFGTVILN
jgi:hypothetical protein